MPRKREQAAAAGEEALDRGGRAHRRSDNGTASCSCPLQSTFSSFDPAAFQAGDVTLGAWRRTASFLERASLDREWSRPRSALEEALAELRCCAPARSSVSECILSRVGTKTNACLVAFFLAFEILRFVAGEHCDAKGVNAFSIVVAANFASLVIALTLSFALEGCTAFQKVFSCRPLWRFAWVAVLFAVASALTLIARRTGASASQIETLGYIYLPLSAIVSYYIFSRGYGKLEWFALGMLTLAIVTFVFLREQYKGVTQIEIERIRNDYTLMGFVLVVLAVVLSVSASILAERIFKDRSRGLKWWSAEFYVMKVHIDFSSLLVSVCLWLTPASMSNALGGVFSAMFEPGASMGVWFGTWGWQQYFAVFVRVGHGWAVGLLVKEFSTVTRAIMTTLTLVLVMCVEDPIMGNRFHFRARQVPSISLGIVIFLSAVIFQTGRLNLKELKRSAQIREGSSSSLHLSSEISEEPNADEGATDEEQPRQKSLRAATLGSEATAQSKETALSVVWRLWHRARTTYALVVVYIMSDALRNIALQKAMSSTVINSNSMCLMQYVCGAAVASLLTARSEGLAGLRAAWGPRRIAGCLPAGFLFALSTMLMNMAYSRGMSAAIALVLGKFYILVAAIGARFLLGKFYMWLEYVAIAILTLASATFGYLQAYDVKTESPSMASLAAMLLVLGSAAAAAFNSLITERILKREHVDFHVQKVRLDAASILCSLALIPVVGLLSSQPQDIPWVERPVSSACPQSSPCWDVDSDTCASPMCSCQCASGLFAGWTASSQAVIVLALTINTVYSWLVGKLVLAFSTMHRAIADSFSLLLIYFVADPVLNGTSLGNTSLNLVASIVPLSTGLFTVAAAEMRKVMQAIDERKQTFSSSTPSLESRDVQEPEASEGSEPESIAVPISTTTVDANSAQAVDMAEFVPEGTAGAQADVQTAPQEVF